MRQYLNSCGMSMVLVVSGGLEFNQMGDFQSDFFTVWVSVRTVRSLSAMPVSSLTVTVQRFAITFQVQYNHHTVMKVGNLTRHRTQNELTTDTHNLYIV